ncbi:MAG: hypothetical protein Q8K70_07940 [Bacteroidota bacterium]|nr:hypothetical protein [Bacteroidota bacterium]
MENTTMDNINTQIEIKRKIIESYFKDYRHINIKNTSFRILFKDVKYLKFIGLPKGLYRSYFLELRENYLNHKIPITAEQKADLKELLRKLYKN